MRNDKQTNKPTNRQTHGTDQHTWRKVFRQVTMCAGRNFVAFLSVSVMKRVAPWDDIGMAAILRRWAWFGGWYTFFEHDLVGDIPFFLDFPVKNSDPTSFRGLRTQHLYVLQPRLACLLKGNGTQNNIKLVSSLYLKYFPRYSEFKYFLLNRLPW